MIGGQGEDSCGLSGRPRKAKPCMEVNRGVISDLRAIYPTDSSLGSIDVVMAHFLFYSSLTYQVVVVVATAEVLAITASIAAC
ncbi:MULTISPECIES: hypothetical protein [Priestia]|uniref:hypothetical protein n=1 Tax=Priestia TaxID=2800373 RepID=UPI001269BC27|nr:MULTISPECIES: hypothetical protein [Priestia]MBX4159695.1 hypothetical protein [Priestia megaterium]